MLNEMTQALILSRPKLREMEVFFSVSIYIFYSLLHPKSDRKYI